MFLEGSAYAHPSFHPHTVPNPLPRFPCCPLCLLLFCSPPALALFAFPARSPRCLLFSSLSPLGRLAFVSSFSPGFPFSLSLPLGLLSISGCGLRVKSLIRAYFRSLLSLAALICSSSSLQCLQASRLLGIQACLACIFEPARLLTSASLLDGPPPLW